MKSPHYDAVIIGSGFGGAITGQTLAKAGLKTLILEKGGSAKRDDIDWDPAEIIIKKRYKSSSAIYVKQYDATKYEETYFNETVGGMSVFYGGASFRLRENDFDTWPIAYKDLEPYYTQAERLLGISGNAGQDPNEPYRTEPYLYPAQHLSKPALRIQKSAIALGLNPFSIPLALNFNNHNRPLCQKCTTCDGFPCKIRAKNDIECTILDNARNDSLFELRADIIVERLIEKNGAINSVVYVDKKTKQRFTVEAIIIILSAGAIQSPAILLRSGLEHFPQHHLIGKYLMRHCNSVVGGVFPFRTNPEKAFHKQICISDFYQYFRESHGMAAGIIQDIYTPADELFRYFAPKWFKGLAFLSDYIQNLLCIAEDEANKCNKVSLSNLSDNYGISNIHIKHQYSDHDKQRLNFLNKKAKIILSKAGGLAFKTMKIDSFSHCVGTLRFGSNSKNAVLNPFCQFFGIDNLFIIDGSFFPSSGGVNPSLTIAANAFRVSSHIINNFKNKVA